jgi:AcrR family transcriptional regulator
MAQVQKEEVRARMQRAALEELAASGWEATTMAAIAARAGVAAANLYRYYPSKQALFDAVVTPELAARFDELLESTVRSLAPIATGDARAPIEEGAGQELLRFWVEHRLVTVILLDRAQGTAYAGFGARFVERLAELTMAEIRAAHPGLRVQAPARQVLVQIFENTRRTIAAILATNTSERAIRDAVAAFRSYQIAGLRGFSRWAAGERGGR